MERHCQYLKSGFALSGRLHILVKDAATGRVLRNEWTPNKIVTTGLDLVRDLLINTSAAPSHIAVGTDNTAPAAGDTALATEVFRNLITRRTASAQKATFQLFLDAGDANGNTLVEAGIFNRSAVGDMLSRVIYAAIVKTAAVTATLTWEITISEA